MYVIFRMRAYTHGGLGSPTTCQHIFASEKLSQIFLALLTGFEPPVFGSQVRHLTNCDPSMGPPEMSRIATCSLFGFSHFPKAGAIYRFWLFNKIIAPVLSTSEKYTCYTHKKLKSVIRKSLKQATLQ